MKNTIKCAALSAALVLASASGLLAGERYTESFASPSGGVPEGWKVAKASAVSVAEVRSAPSGGDALLIQRTPEGVGSAAVFYTGAGAGTPDASMGDFTASVTIRPDHAKTASSCHHGVLIRASKMSYKKSEGYFVAVRPTGKTSGIGIYWNPVSHAHNGDELAFTQVANLNSHSEFILQVKAKGSSIEGQLWSVDSAGAKKDLLGEVSTDEATHIATGHFALRSGLGNSGPVGAWYKAAHISTDE